MANSVDSSDELLTLIRDFEAIEAQLRETIVADDIHAETRLRDLDDKLARIYEQLLDFRVISEQQLLEKQRFLITRLKLLVDEAGLADRIADLIVDDTREYFDRLNAPLAGVAKPSRSNVSHQDELVEVCYTSEARSPFDEQDLDTLCANSQSRNVKSQITGILTYDPATHKFFQVLEGARSAIWNLMNTIVADSRHGNIVVHHQTQIRDRTFNKWAMRYLGGAEISRSVADPEKVDQWVENAFLGGRSSVGSKWISEALRLIHSKQ